LRSYYSAGRPRLEGRVGSDLLRFQERYPKALTSYRRRIMSEVDSPILRQVRTKREVDEKFKHLLNVIKISLENGRNNM
jgi:hypothetical protein